MAVTILRVKVGRRWYTVQVDDLGGSTVTATVDGQTFQVEIEQPSLASSPALHVSAPPAGRAIQPPPWNRPGGPGQRDNVLRAPMPGRIMAIRVRPGDRVAAGQEVCVVEAMKMEQSIRAHRDGVVKAIHVQPLDLVPARAPLVELE